MMELRDQLVEFLTCNTYPKEQVNAWLEEFDALREKALYTEFKVERIVADYQQQIKNLIEINTKLCWNLSERK